MKRFRELFLLLRRFWALDAKRRDMASMAIGTLWVNQKHGGAVGAGLELTVWGFPADSQYGDAACVMGVDSPPRPTYTLATGGSDIPTTMRAVDFRVASHGAGPEGEQKAP